MAKGNAGSGYFGLARICSGYFAAFAGIETSLWEPSWWMVVGTAAATLVFVGLGRALAVKENTVG